MSAPIPCVVYAAKSSSDDKDATATQLAECAAAVEHEGDREIVGRFSEQNVSGFKGERGPKLDAAMKAAREAAEQHGDAELWVWHTSRLARGDGTKGRRSLLKVYADLLYEGVRLRSVHDDEFVRNSMLVGIASEQNNKYSRDLSAWVKGGKDRQMEAGRRLGGPAPDGLRPAYEVDERGKKRTHYELDERRAPIIRSIFELSEGGMGDPSIARTINREGHRTQAGRTWTRRRVQDTVTNPTYAGRVVRYPGKPNQEIVPATNLPALIDPDRFDAIQEGRVKRDRSATGRAQAKGGRRTVRFALSRLAVCERCGGPMRCWTSPYKRKDGTQDRRYICGEVQDQTGACDAPKVSAAAADAALLPHLRGFFVDFEGWLDRVTAAESADRDALAGQAAATQAKLETLTRAETAAQDRYAIALAAGDAAKTEAVERALSRFTAEREQVAASIAELEAAVAELDAAAPVDGMLDFWNALSEGIKGKLDAAQSVAEVNEALRAVLNTVLIDTLPDGSVRLQATFADRDEWWTDDGDIAPDAPPHYPNTIVAEGVPTLPIETGRNSQACRRDCR